MDGPLGDVRGSAGASPFLARRVTRSATCAAKSSGAMPENRRNFACRQAP